MESRMITPARYRSLVLSSIYIEARRRGMPAAKLPPDRLAELGAASHEDSAGVARFTVAVPPDLEAPDVARRVAWLESMLSENQRMLAWKRGAGKPRMHRMEPLSQGLELPEDPANLALRRDARPKDTF